jgi:hypothetical protein
MVTVSGSDHYCAVIGPDVVGELFTLTIGQFRENHFSCLCMVSGTDQHCDANGQEVGGGQLKGWEEGILLNRSLDEEL